MAERPGRLQGHCRGREHRPNLGISVIRDLDIHAATGDHETMHINTEVELVKRHSANNQARFYRLAIWPGLFSGYSFAREYGRKM